jgi:hypothetical protein
MCSASLNSAIKADAPTPAAIPITMTSSQKRAL